MNGKDLDFVPRVWLCTVDREVVMLEVLFVFGLGIENDLEYQPDPNRPY